MASIKALRTILVDGSRVAASRWAHPSLTLVAIAVATVVRDAETDRAESFGFVASRDRSRS